MQNLDSVSRKDREKLLPGILGKPLPVGVNNTEQIDNCSDSIYKATSYVPRIKGRILLFSLFAVPYVFNEIWSFFLLAHVQTQECPHMSNN